MKVAYFTESLLPHVDGVSLTLARLFATLERRGVEFRVYSPFRPGTDVSWSGRVHPVPFVRFPPYPAYRISLPTFPVGAALDDYRPDVVHAASPTPLAARALRYARRHGLPAAASFHTHFVSYFRYYHVAALHKVGWRLLRHFYRPCDAVYAPSTATVRELKRRGIPNARLWSRGIDADRFGPHRRSEALRNSVAGRGPIALFVGRLVREKDLADLAEAAWHLRRTGEAFRLVLVGDGPMRAELKRRLPWAHFTGHQQGDRLASWYASADLFVFPSTTETFGNVVLEAQASGLASVVVHRGGVTDLVRHGETGLIARPNDPRDFAGRMKHVLDDTGARDRIGEAARQEARLRDWDAVNGGLVSDYERLMVDHATRNAAAMR